MVGLNVVMLCLHHNHDTVPFHRIAVSVTMIFSSIYPVTVLVLFAITGRCCTELFKSIRREILRDEEGYWRNQSVSLDARSLPTINSNELEFVDIIRGLKLRYAMACETVECINDCFGPSLLLTTTYLVVDIVNISFYMFGEFDGIEFADIFFGGTSLLHLTLICVVADWIANQVYMSMMINYITFYCYAF